jgi:uncharacterized membrane protein YjfL (UPF0719 family)
MTTILVENEWLNSFLLFLIYLSSSLVLLYLGKLVFKAAKSSVRVNQELTEKDNVAFSFAYVGYFAGLILAVGSAISGESTGLVSDLIDMAIFGLLAIVLLNLSSIIIDKITLRQYSVWKEIITDRNVGMGIIEGANYLASGLIIFGAITGESGNVAFGIYTAIAYWAIGQVLILVTAWLYNKITNYDVHEQIEKDNVAAGIGFAAALIAMANLIRNGLMGDFESWNETLLEVGYEAGLGLIFLPIIRTLVDKILLPGRSLSDEIARQDKPNVGAALVEAIGYIGGSVLIVWCI